MFIIEHSSMKATLSQYNGNDRR